MGSALGLPYFNRSDQLTSTSLVAYRTAKDLTSTSLDVEFNLKRQHRWTLTLSQRLALAVNPKSTTMVLSSTAQNHYRPNKDPLKTRDLTDSVSSHTPI